MGKREAYAEGVFCWAELATTDAEAAHAFYGRLLGWTFAEPDAARLGPDLAAGLVELADDVAPHWRSYVSVESADAAAARAVEAGATIVAPPNDIGTAGRFAALEDPAGAVFHVWETHGRFGAEVVNETGAYCWNDLATTDVPGAVTFYAEALGWDLQGVPDAPAERHAVLVDGAVNGGISAAPAPAAWLACFAVDDVPAARTLVQELSGSALSDVIEVPTGRYAVVADPQGAAFGIIDGEMDP